MERWLNGFIAFKGGKIGDKFPDGIVIGEGKHYNDVAEHGNCLKLNRWHPKSTLFVPLSQVDYFEVWK
jgi:hypothetical protein